MEIPNSEDERNVPEIVTFHDAIITDKFRICEEMLKKGFDVNQNLNTKVIPRRENRLIPRDSSPASIHVACIYRRPEILELLCQHGANPNQIDQMGRTPLVLCILYWPRLARADKSHCNSEEKKYQEYLKRLHKKSLRCVAVLIKYGASANEYVYGKQTVLHLVSRYNIAMCLELLTQNGACLSALDVELNTPLHVAVQYGSSETAEALVTLGANVNILGEARRTPLHLVCMETHVDNLGLSRHFLDHGALVNIKDIFCNTPLHIAAATGREDLIDLLVRRGANTSALNSNGQTPLFTFLDKAFNATRVVGLQTLLDETLFICVTDNLGNLPLLLRHQRYRQRGKLRRYLLNANMCPPLLQWACRQTIRRYIGLDKINSGIVSHLPCPNRLRDFILFKPCLNDLIRHA